MNPRLRLAVFVIDDEKAIGSGLSRLLRDRYDVLVETSGQRALEVLCSPQEFDVILLDIILPDMNAMVLWGQLEQRAPARCARTVMISAAPGLAHDFLNRINRPLLEKPFRSEDVIHAIEGFRNVTSSRGPYDLDPLGEDEEITTGMVVSKSSGRAGDELHVRWLSQKYRAHDSRLANVESKVGAVDDKVTAIKTANDVQTGILLGIVRFLKWAGAGVAGLIALIGALVGLIEAITKLAHK